jgi:hypothetical protein
MHLALVVALLMASRTPLFEVAEHPKSQRHAVLDEEGDVVYLYLTEPKAPRPAADVIAFSTGRLVTESEARKVAEQGAPPPLTVTSASKEAIVADLKASELTFEWKPDGESVCLLHKGRPVAMIVRVGRAFTGYSRAIAGEGSYGKPWSDERFKEVFKK